MSFQLLDYPQKENEMRKVRTLDKGIQWKEGLSAIDKRIDAMHDDLIDKGWTDENEINTVLGQERAEMQEELARNIEGDFSYKYQEKDFVNLYEYDWPDEVISPEERAEESQEDLDDSLDERISADELSNNEPMDGYIPEESADELLDNTNNWPDEVISPEERAEENQEDLVSSNDEMISADELSNSEAMDVSIPEESAEDLVSNNIGEAETQDSGQVAEENSEQQSISY